MISRIGSHIAVACAGALHCTEAFGRQLICALHGLHPDATLAFAEPETAKAA